MTVKVLVQLPVAVLLLLALLSNNFNKNFVKAQSTTGNEFYGLNYGLNIFECPSYYTMKNDFSILKQYTNRIRIFGTGLCNQGRKKIKSKIKQIDQRMLM